jgi:hypothetical protein
MEIVIKLTNENARNAEYWLRQRYKSKANFEKLAKVAILEIAAMQAKEALDMVEPLDNTLEQE